MPLPPQCHPYELVILMERAPVLSGIKEYEGSKWHGHTAIVLRNGKDDTLTFAGPQTWKNIPTNPIKALVWNVWKVGQGQVTQDDRKGWDCWHVFPLLKENFVKAYVKALDYYGKDYQVIGYKADNCVGFTRSIIEAAGIKTPLLMKTVPWPFAVRRFIHAQNKL